MVPKSMVIAGTDGIGCRDGIGCLDVSDGVAGTQTAPHIAGQLAQASVGYRVVSGLVPGSALEEADDRQERAVDESVPVECLDRVSRAGRFEPACRKPQWGNPGAVELDEKDDGAAGEELGPSEESGHDAGSSGRV